MKYIKAEKLIYFTGGVGMFLLVCMLGYFYLPLLKNLSITKAADLPFSVPSPSLPSVCNTASEDTVISNWFKANFSLANPGADYSRYKYYPCKEVTKPGGGDWIIYLFRRQVGANTLNYIMEDAAIIGTGGLLDTLTAKNSVVPAANYNTSGTDIATYSIKYSDSGCSWYGIGQSQGECDFWIEDEHGNRSDVKKDITIMDTTTYFKVFYPRYFPLSGKPPWSQDKFCSEVSALDRCDLLSSDTGSVTIPAVADPTIPSGGFTIKKRAYPNAASSPAGYNFARDDTVTYLFTVYSREEGVKKVDITDDVPTRFGTIPALSYTPNFYPVSPQPVGTSLPRFSALGDESSSVVAKFKEGDIDAPPSISDNSDWTMFQMCKDIWPADYPVTQSSLNNQRAINPTYLSKTEGDIYNNNVNESCMYYTLNAAGNVDKLYFKRLKLPPGTSSGSATNKTVYIRVTFKVK